MLPEPDLHNEILDAAIDSTIGGSRAKGRDEAVVHHDGRAHVLMWPQARDALPVNFDAAGIGTNLSRDQIEECRFAGSVRADDGIEAPRWKIEADIVDCDQAAEPPGQAVYTERHRAIAAI